MYIIFGSLERMLCTIWGWPARRRLDEFQTQVAEIQTQRRSLPVKRLLEKKGYELLDTLMEILAKCKYMTTGKCKVHTDKQCPYRPAEVDDARASHQAVLVNICIPMCVDFSNMNPNGLRLLGQSIITWCAWAGERVQLCANDSEEDILLHESVPSHPSATMLDKSFGLQIPCGLLL